MTRPSFVTTIAALTATDPALGIEPFDDCADLAEALRQLEVTHQGGPARDVGAGTWGRCSECGERWPCPSWVEGELLAVQYLGVAQDRVWAHAQDVMARMRAAEQEKRAARKRTKEGNHASSDQPRS
jgi:hypothetical protein